MIIPGSKYGSIKEQANRDASPSVNDQSGAHGLTSNQVIELQERFDKFVPQLTKAGTNNRSIFADTLPEGASWNITGQQLSSQTSGVGGRNMVTTQTPYQPEFL